MRVLRRLTIAALCLGGVACTAPAAAGAQTLLRDDGDFGRFAEPAGIATDDRGGGDVGDAGARSAGGQRRRRGAVTSGRFAEPAGIATDDGGRVYVADAGAGRVDVFDSASDGN